MDTSPADVELRGGAVWKNEFIDNNIQRGASSFWRFSF